MSMDQENTQHLQASGEKTALVKCPECDTIYSAIAYCPNDGSKLEDHDGAGITHPLFAEKYEILDEIGKGGMGTVYRVKQILLDKILALKIIPSHYLNEQLAVRFQREARTMASLDHPNLARIADFGIWLNQPFMVMEYVDGSPLSKLISERVIPPAQAVDLFCQVLTGLEHAHQKGVLHRDIKPSNIMVRHEEGANKAILVDFGIAKKIETEDGAGNTQALTRTGEMIGSPLYMSPEQARGDKLTERSDLYSLGCALFESLTGTPPFVGKTAVETLFLHIEQTPPSLKEAALGRDFAPGLEKLIRKLLAKNPEDRYASAQELKEALSVCLAQEMPAAPLLDIKHKARPLLPFGLIALAAIVILSVMAVLLHQGEKTAVQVSKKSAMEGSIITELPDSVPRELINEEGKIEYRDENGLGHIQRGTDSTLAFFKKTLSDNLVEIIENDKNLVKLQISYSRFPKSLLAKLPPKLEYIELNGAWLLTNDYKLIATNTNLKTLVLRFNVVDARALHYLAALKKLETLDINGSHVDANALKELRSMRSLRTLILSDNETIDDKALPVLTSLDQLECLDISNTRISPGGLAELSKMAHLKKLFAKRLMLEDKDMPKFKQFKGLEALRLSGNSITAEGISKLPVWSSLKELDCSECAVNDDAIAYFLRYKNLTAIYLSKTPITANGFLKLAGLPHLTVIRFRGNGISIENAHDFLKRCPTCQVVYYAHNDSNRLERSDLPRTKKNTSR